MDEELGDVLLEAEAWDRDLTGVLARLYGYRAEAVYLFEAHEMPTPPDDVALIASWNMKQGAYPLHLAVGPFGDHLPMLRIVALQQLSRELNVTCVADISDDVHYEWVRVTPDGHIESVEVDGAALDENMVIVYPLETPAIAD